MQLLLARGVAVDKPIVAARNFTPLMFAAFHLRVETVEVLIRANASPEAQSSTGEDALTIALGTLPVTMDALGIALTTMLWKKWSFLEVRGARARERETGARVAARVAGRARARSLPLSRPLPLPRG